MRIRPKHIIEIARRRGIVRQAVKSAFFADNPIGLAIAQVYERLMEGADHRARIQQSRFRGRMARGTCSDTFPAYANSGCASLEG